ncbi:hypothetical protein [Asticcacaulis solisilvae]|uniref:hypothetical protein n=1 Tax=Asticcacaulis solisilvae TaxID=1217274 RepID=UPI003FD88489
MHNSIKFMMERLGVPEPYVSMMAMPFSIGTFVQKWSQLEYTAIAMIVAQTGSNFEDERFRFLKQQAADRSKALVSAARRTHPSEAVIIGEKFDKLYPVRNTIIHGFWQGINDVGTSGLVRTETKQNTPYIVELSIVDMEQYVAAVEDLSSDIYTITLQARGHDTASRTDRFQRFTW